MRALAIGALVPFLFGFTLDVVDPARIDPESGAAGPGGNSGIAARWPADPATGRAEVLFWMNPETDPDRPGPRRADVIRAVRAALAAWNDAAPPTLRLRLAGRTALKTGRDGYNVISFGPLKWAELGYSHMRYSPGAARPPGVGIRECDITLAQGAPFSFRDPPGRNDLQAVLTHEMGHCLGLNHNGLPSSAVNGLQLHLRSPGADDRLGLRYLYPERGPAQGGTLRGEVRNESGKPVFGAEVVAADVATGTPVATAVTGVDPRDRGARPTRFSRQSGVFVLPGLPEGGYRISVRRFEEWSPEKGASSAPPVALSGIFTLDAEGVLLAVDRNFEPTVAPKVAAVRQGRITFLPVIRVRPARPGPSPEKRVRLR